MTILDMVAEAQHEGHIPGAIEYSIGSPAEQRAIERRLRVVSLRCPSIAEYWDSGPVVRKCILELWRDSNHAQRLLVDLYLAPCTHGIMPTTHEAVPELGRWRSGSDHNVEPRGFNDRTDGWDSGRPIGSMDQSEWGT